MGAPRTLGDGRPRRTTQPPPTRSHHDRSTSDPANATVPGDPPAARPGQKLCPDPTCAVAVQTGQPPPSLGMGHDPGPAVGESPGSDQPRWNRRPAQTLPGLESRMPPVKNVGKPSAGEPHARFDGRRLETSVSPSAMVDAKAIAGKPQIEAPRPTADQTPPRQPPTLLVRDLAACRSRT